MSVTIGELLVNLRASTASFAKDLSKAEQLSFNTAREMERSFKVMGGIAAGALTAAGAAIEASVYKSIEAADQMGKLAQKTGLTVEQFSGLAYAAKQVDLPVETLAKSFVILSKNLEKSNEQTQEGKAAHSALATLFKGNVPTFKDTNSAFEAIVAQLSLLPDRYQKTALAAQIFSRSGAQLIPLINKQVDGIHAMVAEAREFGVVIGEQTAKNAERFNETMKKIVAVFEGMSLQLAERLLPFMQTLADTLLENSKNASKFEANLNAAATAVKLLATGVITLWGSLKLVWLQINLIASAIENIGTLGLSSKLKQQFVGLEKSMHDTFFDTAEMIQNLWTPAMAKASEVADTHTKKTLDLTKSSSELKKVYDELVKKLSEEITQFTLGSAALETFKLRSEGATAAQIKFVDTLESMVKNLKAGNDAFTGLPPLLTTQANIVDKLDHSYEKLLDKGFRAWEAARTPLEKYSHEVADLKVLLDANIIDQETFNRLTLEWANNLHLVSTHVEAVEKLSKSFQRSIGQAFESAIMGARGFGDIMKSLIASIELAILKTLVFQQIANALKGSGGFLGFMGGVFQSIAGGPKAGGGPVSPGHHYTVGENGPETFYPAVSGTIVPNGGGRMQIVYNIDARGSSITEEQFRRSLQEFEQRAVQRAIHTQRELALRSA